MSRLLAFTVIVSVIRHLIVKAQRRQPAGFRCTIQMCSVQTCTRSPRLAVNDTVQSCYTPCEPLRWLGLKRTCTAA